MNNEVYVKALKVYQILNLNPDAPADICQICLANKWTEKHHLYPTYLGGPKDGPLTTICGNCHANLHVISSTLIRGKTPDWPFNEQQFQQTKRMQMVVSLIIEAAKASEGLDMSQNPKKVNLVMTAEMLTKAHRRKFDTGYTNLQDYILALIQRDTTQL